MKKILLVCLSLGIVFASEAQQVEKRLPAGFQTGVIPAYIKKQAVATRKNAFQQDNALPLNNSKARLAAAPAPAKQNRIMNTTMEEEIIGFTDYDLQTNNSISNRLVRNADGSFSASWTFSPNRTQTPVEYPDRGTGYNYYDPANPVPPYSSHWFFSPDGLGGDFPQTRTEGAYRTGFTNIVTTASGAEMSVAHSSTLNHLLLNRRAAKGTGLWSQQVNALGTGTNNDTWSKATSSGDTVYVICQGTGVQDPPVPLYGQDGPILFSRSVDGGLTWPILRTVIPQIDSSFYAGFGADNYSIDAKNGTVAIAFGDLDTDLGLIKSTDGGMSWTKTIIVTMPMPFFDFDSQLTDITGDGIIDTLITGGGDAAVLIDNNGMCHVWFSTAEWWRDTSNAAGELYAPSTEGLFYWNETMATDHYAQIAGVQDYNGNDTIDFPTDTISCVRQYGRYGWSWTSRPSAGIDAAGTMYVTYMTLIESADTAFYHQLHTHQYVITSPNGGNTWTYPWDLVLPQPIGDGERQECAYGAMARNVADNKVSILYQRDDAPGHSLSNQTCDAANNVNRNDIVFVQVEASTVSVPSINKAATVSVSQNYPNPSFGSTTVNVNIEKIADITVQVTDMLGKVIATTTRSNAGVGINTIQLNTSNWNKGVYLYTVTTQGEKITKQMIVQ